MKYNEISWNPRICDDTVTLLFISKSTQKVMASVMFLRCVSSANCRSDNGLFPAWSHPWATQLQHHRVVSDTTTRYTSSACEAFSWALITPDPSEWAPPLSMEGQINRDEIYCHVWEDLKWCMSSSCAWILLVLVSAAKVFFCVSWHMSDLSAATEKDDPMIQCLNMRRCTRSVRG